MKNEHSLNVHISRYHNQDSVPAQTVCPVCSKTYSNQYSLRTHMHLQADDTTLNLTNQTPSIKPSARFLIPWFDLKIKVFVFSTKINCFFLVRRREAADLVVVIKSSCPPSHDNNLIILILRKMRSFVKRESHARMSKIPPFSTWEVLRGNNTDVNIFVLQSLTLSLWSVISDWHLLLQ